MALNSSFFLCLRKQIHRSLNWNISLMAVIDRMSQWRWIKIIIKYFIEKNPSTCSLNGVLANDYMVETIYRVWHFGFETSQLRNFSIFLWYRFRKKIGIGKSIGISLKRNGIEKSIGINLLLKKFSTIRMACFTQRCILNCSDYSFLQSWSNGDKHFWILGKMLN